VFYGPVGFRQGWLACMKSNAKNRMGAYTGISVTAVLFYEGKVSTMIDNADQWCANRKYTPISFD
jgi:hypothetical protein